MSSLPDLRLIRYNRPLEDALLLERVEDYLDHFCAPLIGLVPYRERTAWREEVRLHLDALIEEYSQDQAPEEATQAALREFGEPWQMGQAFVDEWSRSTPRSRMARLVGTTTLRAFACFGLATMLNQLAIEACLLLRVYEALQSYLLLAAVMSPIIAGWATSIGTSGQTGRAVGTVMLALSLESLAVGLLLLPQTEGLSFALFQVLFWLPVGCLCATLTAGLMKSHRRRRFLHLTMLTR
jgi:hypothetical protein